MTFRLNFLSIPCPIIARALLGAACLLLACGHSQAQPAKSGTTAKPALTVTTARPQQGSLPLRLAANGSIAAWQDASVGSEANGLRIAEVRVDVGDTVQRGQVLAVFAPDSVNADVAQAQAGVAEAQAQAADAAANAERARSFQATGMMSAQQISLLLTAEQTAVARLESARAMLAVQQLRLKHTQVLAPDSGIVSVRNATVGAVVGAGTELFRLIRQGRLEWRAEVTSAELGRLSVGTRATITAASGARLNGKVRTVAPTVDPQTRTALVYVDLAALPRSSTLGQALPGMFARGEFELGASGALTVPQQAVVARDGFNYVFKVAPDNRVSQHKVEVGRRVGEQVEVTQGLSADATIAVAGAGFLSDGDTVRINNNPPSSATPAPAATK
ncbi:MAG: efflux RND transporter periplasmic adaptor subunit [Burkholderiales bacterium]